MKYPFVIRSNFLLKLTFWVDEWGYAFWPFIVIREDLKPDQETTTINHESIHIAQFEDGFVIGSYIIYTWHTIKGRIKLGSWGEAYQANPLELEAYANQTNPEYLKTRKACAWRNYPVT